MKAKYKGVEFEIESKNDFDLLVDFAGNLPVEDIEPEKRGRGKYKKHQTKTKVKFNAHQHWTDEDEQYLFENRMSKPKILAKELGRSTLSVKVKLWKIFHGKAQKVSQPKSSIRRIPFTKAEVEFIAENMDKMSQIEIAEKLGRPKTSVQSKMGVVRRFWKKRGPKKQSESKAIEAKKALEFGTVKADLQQVLSDLVISCAKNKVPLKVSDLVNILGFSESEALATSVEIFNMQKKIFDFIDRASGKIVWRKGELSFR